MSGESRPARENWTRFPFQHAAAACGRKCWLASPPFSDGLFSHRGSGMLGKAGFSPTAVFVATCLVASFGSLIMGLWANLPMAIGCAIS